MLPFAVDKITIYNSFESVKDNKLVLRWNGYFAEKGFYKNIKNMDSVGVNTTQYLAKLEMNSDFVESIEWNKLPYPFNKKYFTCKNGDVIILDEIIEEIPINSDCLIFLSQLKNADETLKYPDVFNKSFVANKIEINNKLLTTAHVVWGG